LPLYFGIARDFHLVIDSGLHPKKVGRLAAPNLTPLQRVKLDLIIITHCHLDHIGSLPVVMREHPDTPVIMTTSSRMLIERMLHNSANVMLRQKEEEDTTMYKCPVYRDARRKDENRVFDVLLRTDHEEGPDHWIKRGVALLTTNV